MDKRVEEILAEAHAIRHRGIRLENHGRLEEAEKLYDEALALYREHDKNDTLDYANAVRYPAVVKNRLGNRDESTELWIEAFTRYEKLGILEGVAGAGAWLTIFAIERNDLASAHEWFEKADAASARSEDPDTHKFVNEVRSRLTAASPP